MVGHLKIGESGADLPSAVEFLGTPLTPTSYAELSRAFWSGAPDGGSVCMDFTNTHIVSLRRINRRFRDLTDPVDFFIPDSMPLTWSVNAAARRKLMHDRVYGPRFLRECVADDPGQAKHYFLGGSAECLDDLLAALRVLNPQLRIAGSHHGYFAIADREKILQKIRAADPDLIWIGLGTPKQQEFAAWLKPQLSRGVLLLVGFAFDVNAGRKPDAPMWMQRAGLTWAFRLASEPKRLFGRYLFFNAAFLTLAAAWFVRHIGRPKASIRRVPFRKTQLSDKASP